MDQDSLGVEWSGSGGAGREREGGRDRERALGISSRLAKFPEGKSTGFFSKIFEEKSGGKIGFVINTVIAAAAAIAVLKLAPPQVVHNHHHGTTNNTSIENSKSSCNFLQEQLQVHPQLHN